MAEDRFKQKIKTAAIMLVVVFFAIVVGGYYLNDMPKQDHRHLRAEVDRILITAEAQGRDKIQVAQEKIQKFFPKNAQMISLERFFKDNDGQCQLLPDSAGTVEDAKNRMAICDYPKKDSEMKWTLKVSLDSQKKLVDEVEIILN